MPKQESPKDYVIKLTDEQIALIEELAKLQCQTFQETLDDVVNEILSQELPQLLGRLV